MQKLGNIGNILCTSACGAVLGSNIKMGIKCPVERICEKCYQYYLIFYGVGRG